MAKLVEGLWDCQYCGKKGIGGLTKQCPNCGHPQDKDIRFYIGKGPKVLSEEESQRIGTKADWVCAYCGSYNNANSPQCANCGAAREEQEGDYFAARQAEQIKEELKKKKAKESAGKHENGLFTKAADAAGAAFWSNPFKGIKFILMALVLLVGLGIIAVRMIPRNHSGVVQEMSWERSIAVEEYSTVRENGWSVPDGGRVVDKKREIRSYRQVLDHYETVSEQVPYQLQDGYDTDYVDNGNGTFTEEKTPRYRTEYRTETRQQAVYRNEPVYDTKYYYDIDKWHYARTEFAEGNEQKEPVWPDVQYAENQREQSREENYQILFYDEKKDNTYPYSCSQTEWESFSVGKAVDFVVQMGTVTKINSK